MYLQLLCCKYRNNSWKCNGCFLEKVFRFTLGNLFGNLHGNLFGSLSGILFGNLHGNLHGILHGVATLQNRDLTATRLLEPDGFRGRDPGYQVGGTDHHQQGDRERTDVQ